MSLLADTTIRGNSPALAILVHIRFEGDVWFGSGELAGTIKSDTWIEGFNIKTTPEIEPSNIEYRALMADGSISPRCQAGEYCGSRGERKALVGFSIRTTGPLAEHYICEYSATFSNRLQYGPVQQGQPCYSNDGAAIQQMQVALVPKTGLRGQSADAPSVSIGPVHANGNWMLPVERDLQVTSLRDAVKHGKNGVAFTVTDQSAIVETRPPSFCFGATDPTIEELQPFKYLMPAIGTFAVEGASLSDGFIITRDNNIFYDDAAKISVRDITKSIKNSNILTTSKKQKVLDTAALLWTHSFPTYGHWIVDIVPQVEILKNSGYDLKNITFPLPTYAPSFANTFLKGLGIDSNQILYYDVNAEVLLTKILLIPAWTQHWRFMNHQIVDGIRSLADNHGVTPPNERTRRLYIGRSSSYKRRALINKHDIITIAEQHGFEYILPETIPIIDQWRLFSMANIICGEYGSALHNSVFSAPGTVVIGLRGFPPSAGFAQSAIGEVFNQPTGYIFGELMPGATDGSYMIDERVFRSGLQTVLSATYLK